MVTVKVKYLMFVSFVITLVGNFLDYGDIVNLQNSLFLSYFFIFFPVFIGIIPVSISVIKRIKFEYVPELCTGVFVLISLLCISLYKSFKVHVFIIGTVGELTRIFIPFVYAFLIINYFSKREINLFMKISLLFAILAFVLTTDFSKIALVNIISISFSNSYSPFENSEISFLSYALSIYFIYYFKDNPIWGILSIILVFMTFKRVFIISELILIILVLCGKKKKKINSWVLYISSIIFILLVKVYMFLAEPQNYFLGIEKFHFDIAEFSMYRIYRVWYLLEHNFISYGLGSTTRDLQSSFFRGATLELDFIKIMMELGIVAIIIFIFSYYRLGRDSLYSYVVMSSNFLQLLMANDLTRYFEWSIILVSIGIIFYMSNSDLENDKILWPFVKLKRK